MDSSFRDYDIPTSRTRAGQFQCQIGNGAGAGQHAVPRGLDIATPSRSRGTGAPSQQSSSGSACQNRRHRYTGNMNRILAGL